MHASDSRETTIKSFGPYCIERRIAVGGSAEVFLAHEHDDAERRVIVKRLLPSMRETGNLDLLTREANLHRHVNHPNVVKVDHAGQVEGEPYIAMEYVHGLDLYRLLQRSSSGGQPIPHDLAVFIARNVADALSAVHTARSADGDPLSLMHGDISPSNIYLSDSGRVKLGDFGIARVLAEQQAHGESQRSAGHFGYFAPEQLNGEGQDQRSDIFSLGVTLGELLIGQRIFPGSGQLAILLSIRDANILPLRRAAEQLPSGLFAVCERALARDPEQRYATASEFSDALRPFEEPHSECLQKSLASWVAWAMDHEQFVEDLQKRVRQSVGVMHAAHRSSSGVHALKDIPAPANDAGQPQVRRIGTSQVEEVPFSKLIEMVATGELSLKDEVALWGAPFEAVGEIEELARHLLPSTTSVTSRMFSINPPDFVAHFSETPFLEVLGRLHNERESGSLFVQQSFKDREQRKDIHIKEGRLHHVASNDPQELLGEYLVAKGLLERPQLDLALRHMATNQGQLGETLIVLGMVDPVDVFTAIRNQGRDRVASMCGWQSGTAQLYRDTSPGQVLFPLDLDLTICMMWGAMHERLLAPDDEIKLALGPNAPAPNAKRSSVALLNLVPGLARKKTSVGTARTELRTLSRNKPSVAAKQAEAALIVARALGWIQFR